MKEINVNGLGDLPDAAEEILAALDGRNVVALYGPMGAGKTTLVREICARLGSEDTVTSPTFALINRYNSAEGDAIFHFDFYRIERQEEAFDMGYEEYFYSDGLCLVEWPEKVEELLPDDVMKVTITPTSNTRRVITID
ncbi:MAG: tRNA (adenosine(37)-N6)-threonylcarbamoyltransferase complex ATPase subunit type 1 TsaE [Tidjanibacter sp.]|nr:tRNA (adenosine(37)-N6)-threonylcarbamoyltransferase complex ATPase subunit type 1 TsaE [Tidjanibacter sp.]MBR3681967.1 tRNA (adenosine(37)-N6)-threonylcarbamoyltransferase complex ATPase subunit type 1 TsaE [Tidjanibacter sp.]MBR3853755.1 tRNA (adenosine(37)-N6)-threonylcarbamoyltransferase complex ATPase subunit type 1 TsaE [Tidjanibacter sp.]MBR7129756.1 tRNA (adenosine(37)-N6)-threonylcarbamoyltransferase complex ATPase subunit type 1 TsaE [Tidjanibacter sp.]